MQTNIITKSLGIKGIKVTNYEEVDNKVIYHCKSRIKPKKCPCCGSKRLNIHDHRIQDIKDLPHHNKETIIRFDVRRFKCLDCNKRFTEDKPFVDKKCQITNRLKLTVLEELREMITMKSVAKRYFISPTTVAKILDSIRVERLSLGEVLNIDEFSGDTGEEKYQVILADSQNKQITDILPSRKYKYLAKYFSKIPKEKREKVKVFVSDMYRPYKSIMEKYFPNAVHIIDIYHFVRQVVWGFENVRKAEANNMPKAERIHFKRSRSLLTKPMEWLSSEERLQASIMLERNENIKQAYLTKETFYKLVMESKDSKEAKENIEGWIEYLLSKGSEKWQACLRAFKNWLEPIANSFDYEYTNGYVEGKNNKTKTLKRISYGMKNFERFRNRILLLA